MEGISSTAGTTIMVAQVHVQAVLLGQEALTQPPESHQEGGELTIRADACNASAASAVKCRLMCSCTMAWLLCRLLCDGRLILDRCTLVLACLDTAVTFNRNVMQAAKQDDLLSMLTSQPSVMALLAGKSDR